MAEDPVAAGRPPSQMLDRLVAAARGRLARRARRNVPRLLVGAGGCCLAVGAAEVATAIEAEAAGRGLPVEVREAGCTGMCFAGVQVTLQRPGHPDITWSRIGPDEAGAVIGAAVDRGPGPALSRAFAWSDEPEGDLPGLPALPFLAGQRRLLSEHLGRVDPTSVDEALVRGIYRGLARALDGRPEAVVETVESSGLAGRGGAYFPTGRKWRGCRDGGGPPRYLVVNAEEGEPGVFKDRHIVEGDPHRLIEGALIAAFAIGAEQAFVYLNGQAHLAGHRLISALTQAEARGLIGERILGSPFSCRLWIRHGGGGYVLGEETVLLESIEGRRAMPRIRPPYPVSAGLWERPTAIDNVETLANVPLILDRGAEWFRHIGAERWPGTKLVSVSGDVVRPGLVELETGTPLRRVLFDLAGGVPGGRALQAVLTGGPSGNLVPLGFLDSPLEPRRSDLLLGSGSVIALDDRHDLLEVVRGLTAFNAEESCGKCTPCREGVNRMHEILDRIAAGRPRPGDRADLRDLAEIAASASICGLGQMAPNPVRSLMQHFRVMSDES